ncbi:MAG: hypothetical protein P8Y70_10435 [Candidatus Lokiarchaeota archaeon]
MISNKGKELFDCPFMGSCVLPKHPTCNFPDYKQCPEYSNKVRKIKIRAF